MDTAELAPVLARLAALEREQRRPQGERITYATGTWTPVLAGDGTAGTFTYAIQSATYTRLGNRVLFAGQIRISAVAVAPTGNMQITGLPFTAANTGFEVAGGADFSVWAGITFPAGFTQLGGQVFDAESQIRLARSGSASLAARVQGGEVGLVGGVIVFRFAGSYQV